MHCGSWTNAASSAPRYGDVTFGDTKEGGLFSIRVPTSMDAKVAGRIENSADQVFENGQGEEVTWGQQAAWVDYSGPLANGEEWGHTVVDHRDKPPAIRPTGTCAATGCLPPTPLACTIFKGDESIDESLTIPGGDQAVFRYRLIIHPGRSVDGHPDVRQLIEQFQAG